MGTDADVEIDVSAPPVKAKAGPKARAVLQPAVNTRELFREHLARGMSPAQAWVAAGNAKTGAISSARTAIATDPDLQAAFDQGQAGKRDGLRGDAEAAAETVDAKALTTELMIDRALARQAANYGASIRASVAIAEINGLITGPRANEREPLRELPEEILRARAEQVERELAALGIAAPAVVEGPAAPVLADAPKPRGYKSRQIATETVPQTGAVHADADN